MEKRMEIAEYILKRHREEIEKEEVRSLSRLRQLISPYSEYVAALKLKVLSPLAPYRKEEKLLDAVKSILAHCSGIEAIQLPVQYSLSFEEMDALKAAPPIDKALLVTSLLRAVGSETAATVIGKECVLVQFSWLGEKYAIDIEKNSLLSGKEAEDSIKSSKPKYIFNDLFFEFGEEG